MGTIYIYIINILYVFICYANIVILYNIYMYIFEVLNVDHQNKRSIVGNRTILLPNSDRRLANALGSPFPSCSALHILTS